MPERGRARQPILRADRPASRWGPPSRNSAWLGTVFRLTTPNAGVQHFFAASAVAVPPAVTVSPGRGVSSVARRTGHRDQRPPLYGRNYGR